MKRDSSSSNLIGCGVDDRVWFPSHKGLFSHLACPYGPQGPPIMRSGTYDTLPPLIDTFSLWDVIFYLVFQRRSLCFLIKCSLISAYPNFHLAGKLDWHFTSVAVSLSYWIALAHSQERLSHTSFSVYQHLQPHFRRALVVMTTGACPAGVCNSCRTSAPSRGEQSRGWLELGSRTSPLCLLLYSPSASYSMVIHSKALVGSEDITTDIEMTGREWLSIATGCGLNHRGSGLIPRRKTFLFSPQSPDRLGDLTASYPACSFVGVKRSVREADHSLLSCGAILLSPHHDVVLD
jgi:hypothetical protein